MPRKPNVHPTEAELAILQVLWRDGPSTVRHVHEQLTVSQKIGYTTVLKTLQIMTEKGLVRRDESQRAHVYAARRSEEQTQKRLLGDLLDRAYRGSAGKLVMQALSSRRASPEELAAIRRMLDEMSGETKNGDD
jgi:BlaI family penicillinase repressor